MATIEEKFIPINILVFKDFSEKINFDIYLKLNEGRYLHLFKRGYNVEPERINNYIKRGLDYLYIKEPEKQLFIRQFKVKLERETSPDKKGIQDINIDVFAQKTKKLNSEEIKAIEKNVETLTIKCIDDLFHSTTINPDQINTTVKLVKDYIATMLIAPDVLTDLIKDINENSYFHYHSFVVSVLSLFVANFSPMSNERLLKIVGLGGLLHDVGKTGSKEHELNPIQSPEIMKEDRYIKHPEIGYEILKNVEHIPEEAKIIVFQHHEKNDGSGFPNQLTSMKLYYPSRIVALSNTFSKMVSKKPFGIDTPIPKALADLKQFSSNYDEKIIQALCKLYEGRS